jgi:N-acetylglucosamine malate deacetylase 2
MEPAVLEMFARATAAQDDARSMPRALLVFAHPDDETIAVGARMARFADAHMVYVTDAVPRNGLDCRAHGFTSIREYREARWRELDRMLKTAGVPQVSRQRLDIADQEASLQLTRITRRLIEILQKRWPEVVFTHPYEGGHPDHDACAFAVHHAVALLHSRRAQAPSNTPLIIEAPFYHADPTGIGVGMQTGTFLPASRRTEEIVFPLLPEEQERKRALIDCFTAQQEALSHFHVTEERFRIAPEYEFRLPPHAGAVFYDGRQWGMSSQWFCELAWEAERALEEEMRTALC